MREAPLNVVQIGFFQDPEARSPAQILRDWPALSDVAEMVARQGARVTVIQACAEALDIVQNNVAYRFRQPQRNRAGLFRAQSFEAQTRELRADIFHVHGLGFPDDVRRLARLEPQTPILLQDHADRVPPLWRPLRRRAITGVDGFAFCAREQARPFRSAGMIRPGTPVFEVPESSSRFSPGDREVARRATGVHGNPALLWVGHLDANKDPLTVLDGVAAAAAARPDLHLWCCFDKSPLLTDVLLKVARDPRLSPRVHILGRVPHARVEMLMRAADAFVLGSRREGSGFSVIEALACGLPPIVTDIPSYRALTDNGRVGALWTCGDASTLCKALLGAAGPDSAARHAVRAHFEREISFDAVGRKLLDAYGELCKVRRTGRNASAMRALDTTAARGTAP